MTRSVKNIKKQGKLGIISSTEYISVGDLKSIPAKIDTGADSSSIWASDIEVDKDGILRFKLFAKNSPYYTGEVIEKEKYTVSAVRSSNGEEQIRYRAMIPIKICNRTIKASLTLADRKKNKFPVLIGRRTISGKFLVDVSKAKVEHPARPKTRKLNKELNENPYEFHKKYVKGVK
jgi:hypothetical protein